MTATFGTPQVLGTFVLVASGGVALILQYLDKLVDPVDVDSIPAEQLDGYIRALVEWRLFPLMREVGTNDPTPSLRAIDRVLTSYNVRLEKILRAKFSSEDFRRAETTMRRSLIYGAIVILPAVSLFAMGSLDWTALATAGPFVIAYTVLMALAIEALSRARRSRLDYRLSVSGLDLARSDDQSAHPVPTAGTGP